MASFKLHKFYNIRVQYIYIMSLDYIVDLCDINASVLRDMNQAWFFLKVINNILIMGVEIYPFKNKKSVQKSFDTTSMH